MPSLLVHLGVGALIAAALLSRHYDWKALAVVLAVVALPDLDTIIGIWVTGAHRTVLHNIWIVVIPAALLAWDVGIREESTVRTRFGDRGVRIGWVSLVALAVGHILLDAFYNGVNLFWPLHDTFYDLSGSLIYSTDRGFVQTFVDVSNPEAMARGTTEDVHYRTGVDPAGPGESPDDLERIFYLINSGELLVLTIAGYLIAGYRLLEVHRPEA